MLRYFYFILVLGLVGGWFVLRFVPQTTFVEGVVGQPGDLIPGRGSRNAIDETIEDLLFRSLFVYDTEGRITSDLVEDYSISSGGKVYHVTLKESFWLDGQPITTADVAFTFTQNPAFSDVTVEQEGKKKIRFVLKNPLSSFLEVLTQPIAPAHFRDLELSELGSGDFSILDVKQEGETVTEIRLRNRGAGRIKTLAFKFFDSEEELIQAAQQGEVDALLSDNFADPSFYLFEGPIFSRYFALLFNLESKNALIGRRDFRQTARQRTPTVGSAAVEGPFSGTWAEADLRPPSSKETKKFKGGITITAPKAEGLAQIAEEIATSWREGLGITVKVAKVAPSKVNEILAERNFEAAILGQEVERDPDRYNLWHSTQKDFPGQNISGYADPRADRALEEGRKALNRSVRKAHYRNFERLFIADNPAILLYHPQFHYWVSRKFTGLDLSRIFTPEERFRNFQEWGRF